MPNIPWTRVSTYNNFTPTAFSGCTLWLDAADSSSISTTSGNVTQWRDKSGNANHTTAGTGQPTYTSPFVVFGGSAQLILPLVFSTDWSIFVVAKTTQTTGTSCPTQTLVNTCADLPLIVNSQQRRKYKWQKTGSYKYHIRLELAI